MAGKRNYSDLKYKFIRGLQRQEIYQRSKHWLKSAAEWTSRAIVSLDLCDRPVKSVKQAEKLEGIGTELKKKLEKIKEDTLTNEDPPVKGKFASSASAMLVALLEATELAYSEGHSKDSSVLVPEDVVRTKVKGMCEENFLDTTDTNKCVCPGWWRIEVLIRRDLVKRRTLHKNPVYLLLPLGMEEALRLREQSGRVPICSTSTVPWSLGPDNSDVLYTNYDGSDGVVLLVDISEMGGDRVGLGNLCRMIEEMKITYKTKKLPVGDYSWGWNCDGQERILPFLVERKRADDVARTLKEGRFWTQVTKMVEWKNQFIAQGLECQLQYIVEGEPEQYMVKCMDGCQGVGMCGNPTVIQVKNALRDLRSHPDLSVQQTDNIEDTVILLASITAELQQRVERGDFDDMIVKELNKNSGIHSKQQFYVVDNDGDDEVVEDEITIIDSRSNSPDLFTENNNRKSPAPGMSDDRKLHKHSIVEKQKKVEQLPLEPLVQYHCSSGVQASPTKRRTTPSKYHVEVAYKPKMDYVDDVVFDENETRINQSKSSIVPKKLLKINQSKSSTFQNKYLDIDNKYEDCVEIEEDNHRNIVPSRQKTVKHKLHCNQPETDITKKKCPRTKTFKMVSATNIDHQDITPSHWSEEESVPSAHTSTHEPRKSAKHFVTLPSVDSAISSDDDIDIQNFARTRVNLVSKSSESRQKFDSALSDSDSDSLPDINLKESTLAREITNNQRTRPSSTAVNPSKNILPTKNKPSQPSFLTPEQIQHIKTVRSILPQVLSSDIQTALQRNGWNVDRAVTELLDTETYVLD